MMQGINIRTELLPGDIENIVGYHDTYYAANYGFNHDFGMYVRYPLKEFFTRNCENERIWLLEENGVLKGCIALAGISAEEAQLRWFFVDESLRCRGNGQKLINLLISFALEKNYQRIILWTVSLLREARHLYEKNGFILEEVHETYIWGKVLVEQKFTMQLRVSL